MYYYFFCRPISYVLLFNSTQCLPKTFYVLHGPFYMNSFSSSSFTKISFVWAFSHALRLDPYLVNLTHPSVCPIPKCKGPAS